MLSTYIIAEPGSTHGGDPQTMRDLVKIAQEAGCNALKWQFVSSAAALAERRHAKDYERHYRAIAFPLGVLDEMLGRTREAGLDALCTVYLPEDVPLIASRVDKIKIASFEARDALLLRLVSSYENVPRLISTGMMTEVEAMEVTRYAPEILFHCVSAYPAPPEALNLAVIRRWRSWDNGPRIGFSDHSADVTVGALAVAAGAQALEVHFRHPATSPANADYATALDPARLTDYVGRVRAAEVMLGTGDKAPQSAEAAMVPFRVP